LTVALDALASGAASILGRALGGAELAAFDKYLKLLQKWQKSQRLIGSSDDRWIVDNLFLDSLLFLRVLPAELGSLADVGSGAGLPGIPIKIVRPEVRVALIESRGKRASFLAAAVRELGLAEAYVIDRRAEEYATANPGAFDAVVMRCAGDFGETVKAASLLAHRGGLVVAAGPPKERALAVGAWVEVEGYRAGVTRRFAVHRPG
jgi:16S rRNA (guanine527-N7)-methyltransferase